MDTWKLQLTETAFNPREAAALLSMREDEFNTRVAAGVFWADEHGGFSVRALIKAVLFSSMAQTKIPVDKIVTVSIYSAKAAIFYALEQRPRLAAVRVRDGGGRIKFSTCMTPPSALMAGLSRLPVNRYLNITTERAWVSPVAGHGRGKGRRFDGRRKAHRGPGTSSDCGRPL